MQAKLGTLHVNTEAGPKELGEGAPVASVRASRFELVRAMTGRRSRAQLHGLDWGGNLDPAELLLSTEIFTLPEGDVRE